jgi:hypothetical protein
MPRYFPSYIADPLTKPRTRETHTQRQITLASHPLVRVCRTLGVHDTASAFELHLSRYDFMDVADSLSKLYHVHYEFELLERKSLGREYWYRVVLQEPQSEALELPNTWQLWMPDQSRDGRRDYDINEAGQWELVRPAPHRARAGSDGGDETLRPE